MKKGLHNCSPFFIIREPLKTGLKRENGSSAPNAMKADEVRLYALRGGLKKQAVCYTHFLSNKVFRGDHNKFGVLSTIAVL